jgi:hypothetical protein
VLNLDGGGSIGVRSSPGGGKCYPPLQLRWASVYDGHDGVEAAKLASETLHASVRDKLTRMLATAAEMREETATFTSGGARTRARSCEAPLDDATVQRAMREAIAELDHEFAALVRLGTFRALTLFASQNTVR